MKIPRILVMLLFTFPLVNYLGNAQDIKNTEQIKPFPANPWYWEYKGRPILLLGSSDDDLHVVFGNIVLKKTIFVITKTISR